MVRCAIYTRKSTSENLDTDFNSLDAQRESCELYIQSQVNEGWVALPEHYDDGAYSGATMERPAVQRLLQDIRAGKIDIIVVYKIDRLSRNLLDFSQTLQLLEQHGCSFASVTEQFNTKTPMGRFALNVISSFSQMEREVIAERIRDKVAASKKRGKYLGGVPPLGYDVDRERKKLIVNDKEALLVRFIFQRYLQLQSVVTLVKELNAKGYTTKTWTLKNGHQRKGHTWNKSHVYRLLNNPIYIGRIKHKDTTYPGEHEAIIEKKLWDEAHRVMSAAAHGGNRHSPTPALLKGILVCGHCGTPMGMTFTTKAGKRYRYYLCQHANKSGYDACPIRTVPAGDIENLVMMQVRRVLSTPEVIAETFRQVVSREAATVKELDRQVAALNDELVTLQSTAERLREPTNNAPDFASTELTGITTRIDDTQGQLDATEAERRFYHDHPLTEHGLANELHRLDGIWEELFPGERARIIHLLIDKVVVTMDGIDIVLQADGIEGLASEMKGEATHAEQH